MCVRVMALFSMHFEAKATMWTTSTWHGAGRGRLLCGGQGALEHENVGLWLVDHVVAPSDGLLHAQLAPLSLLHKTIAGDVSCILAG